MLRLHPEAMLELEQAIAYHERERPGFGAKLFVEVKRAITLASALPQAAARSSAWQSVLTHDSTLCRVFASS